MEEITLIANSGIHFKSVEAEFDLDQPLVLKDGKTLKYTFLETRDFLDMGRIKLDVCSSESGLFSSVSYLVERDLVEREPDGMVALNECGVPMIKKGTVMNVIETYNAGHTDLMNINALSSMRFNTKVSSEDGSVEVVQKTGFEMLLGKWLPMPMYEYDGNNNSTKYPNGWCRVRIDRIGERIGGSSKRYRLTWAFDTRLAEDLEEAKLRPAFFPGSDDRKVFKICNRADLLLGEFLNIPDGNNETPVVDYLASLWDINLAAYDSHMYKFIAYYVYLINYLRLSGASPRVTLYHKLDKQIPVDMSIDIGNSRTCAVLFEKGDFTKARMLRIRDLSQPWRTYENAFDMRVVFRKADFGGDLTMGKSLFQWNSLVRIGEEAKHLIYHSLEGNDESERTTNYSSPKRYLWDNRLFDSRWELMVEEDDPTNIRIAPQIYMKGFTDYFDDDGAFLGKPKEIDLFSLGKNDKQCHYSRSSLMTFVMVEILQHALNYINSSYFRGMHGEIDCSRYLRNIIITCPTAMPLQEQLTLRKAAKDASILLRELTPSLPEMTITPDPEKLLPAKEGMEQTSRGWLYDEAFASQLVFLYAELSERYDGKIDHFFKLKGHQIRPRTDDKDSQKEENVSTVLGQNGKKYEFNGNALTIGTIDIGAGTTDVMITVYGQKGQGKLVPVPVFYDSFYTAGDDILHNLIRDVVIEGKQNDNPIMGSISSSLTARIKKMTPDELLGIPRVAQTKEYRETVEEIRNAMNEEVAMTMKYHLIHELMHHFFADNTAGMSEKDRRCRLDFCTQISHPMSQFFLELLKQGRPTRVYSFQEMFPNDKPANYLLEHFAYNFGFRFEDLLWRFEPEVIADVVRSTMKPIIKSLSEIIFQHNCDFLVLSGRPTNLKPLTELFLENIPVPPNRMICLNSYHVGHWFPLATQEGYFQENQKAVVSVGAEVGYLASKEGFNGLVLDFSVLEKEMKSSARYIGLYDDSLKTVREPILTPKDASALLKGVSVFPCYLGCKQYNSPKYESRPLYAIYNNSGLSQLNIRLQRDYFTDRESIWMDDVTDMEGNNLDAEQLAKVDLRLQTLASETGFWMDKGAFVLTIQVK